MRIALSSKWRKLMGFTSVRSGFIEIFFAKPENGRFIQRQMQQQADVKLCTDWQL